MVKLFILCVFLSFSVNAETIHGGGTVPKGEFWIVTNFDSPCFKVCTADIYVTNGGVKIGGVWVYGVFDFSFDKNTSIIIDSDTEFHFGDSLNSIEIERQDVKY